LPVYFSLAQPRKRSGHEASRGLSASAEPMQSGRVRGVFRLGRARRLPYDRRNCSSENLPPRTLRT